MMDIVDRVNCILRDVKKMAMIVNELVDILTDVVTSECVEENFRGEIKNRMLEVAKKDFERLMNTIGENWRTYNY